VTSDRCPACGAAVTAGAPWCTLCYADLRVPELVPVPVSAPVTVPASAPALLVLEPDPILDAPVAKAAPVARQPAAGWPCLGCGAQVPLADNACPHCGRPFLPAEEMPSLALPGVGDLSRMDRAQKITVIVVGSTVVTALLIALAFVAGSIL
jgi:hypothetical protein